MTHTVLIADDSEIVRNASRKVLAREPSIEIVGEADSFETIISRARELQPDVILLDLHMPDDRRLEPQFVRADLPRRLKNLYSWNFALKRSGRRDLGSR